jgi:hypothetical protein
VLKPSIAPNTPAQESVSWAGATGSTRFGTPKLKLIKEILLTREPEVAEFPTAGLYMWLSAAGTVLFPKGTIVLHCRF